MGVGWRLFYRRGLYDLAGTQALFFRAMTANVRHHMARCPDYAAILRHCGFSPDDMAAVYALCETFLPVLEAALARLPGAAVLRAGATLERYAADLAAALGGPRVFYGARACLAACEDSALESAPGFGHAWVRRLPRGELLTALRLHKGHLQTAALLCADEERRALAELLFKAGAVRVTTGARMSRAYGAEAPRDGEHALRRYMKVTTLEGFEA
ncbi:MAG: hypothetical protein LBC26_02390 [Oscillospiraceae bacterium]|jgi:hypothetical protein|nr:hypothetical protein [Oscillospiraceae bacterium]